MEEENKQPQENNTTISTEDVLNFIHNNKDIIPPKKPEEKDADNKKGIFTPTPEELGETSEVTQSKEYQEPVGEYSEEDAKVLRGDDDKEVEAEDTSYKHPRESFTTATEQELLQEADPTKKYLVDVSKIKVTETEKEDYLRAVLTDEVFWLKVSLMKGKLNFKFKNKTLKENEFISRYLLELFKDNPALDFSEAQQELCKINFVVQLSTDLLNSPLYKAEDSDVLVDISDCDYDLFKKIVKLRIDILTKISGIKWIAFINALRIFDEKFSQLAEMVANEDF